MEELLAKYTRDLSPQLRTGTTSTLPDTPRCVLLTGSTGSLGSYILDLLARDDRTEKVYCLNRHNRTPLKERQSVAMSERGLETSLPSKVILLESDLAHSQLGLKDESYSSLQREVTHIIHNAWDINFRKELHEFESHIQGVRNLVDLCINARLQPSLFFTSTLGVGMGWSATRDTPLPEQLISLSCDPVMGYSQAKLVAEHLLAEATRVAGVHTSICRIGQVAGPTHAKGLWSQREWFPSLLRSSEYMGYIPEHLGASEEVSWMPVDLLAAAVLELCFSTGNHVSSVSADLGEKSSTVDSIIIAPPPRCRVYHAINPSTTTYAALLPTIIDAMSTKPIKITFQDWVARLEDSNDDAKFNPARKLLYMWHSHVMLEQNGLQMTRLATTNTAPRSKCLREMGPVRVEWMRTWMMQWGYGKDTQAKL